MKRLTILILWVLSILFAIVWSFENPEKVEKCGFFKLLVVTQDVDLRSFYLALKIHYFNRSQPSRRRNKMICKLLGAVLALPQALWFKL